MSDPTKPLDFEILHDIVVNRLNAGRAIALATAGADGVHNRVVEFANHGLKLCFFTWNNTRKATDIARNPNVALCLDEMQIEGFATVQQNLARGNADMMLRYRSRQPAMYARFMALPNTCLIVVQPRVIRLMKIEDDAMQLDVLDVEGKRAYRTKLADWHD